MRTLFVFVVGIAVGAFALYYYEHNPGAGRSGAVALSGSARDAAGNAAVESRAAANRFSAALNDKIREWHLTREDIHADLQRGGEIVRQNTERAREKVADVRIVAVIKAKYLLDRDLSATAITVDSKEGDVTLNGSAASEELIGRAVALALDTDGVHHVTAKLRVAP